MSPPFRSRPKPIRCVSDMTTQNKHDNPILVTGAAGAVGGIGRSLTEFLLARGHKVRALVRREDERAEALRRLGAEVVKGDLTDLASMHRAIEGCRRIYFGMSVSPAYLEATVNTAVVARYHGVEAFVNMSQMTVSQMSITETTDSPQHKLHWLAEQALSWSGLPVVTVRPTVFLEGFFLLFAATSVREADDLDQYARVFSETLGRTIRYRDVPVSEWSEKLRAAGVPEHVVHHLTMMTELHKEGHYDRMSEDYRNLTGETPTSMADFVKLHAAEFTRP